MTDDVSIVVQNIHLLQLLHDFAIPGVNPTPDIQPTAHDDNRNTTNGYVNQEAPAPSPLRKHTTQQRSQRRPNSKHRMLDSQVRPPLPQRHNVAQYHLGEEIDAAGPETLHDSSEDENSATIRGTAYRTADCEDSYGGHHGVLATPHVAELTVQRLEDCTGEEERGSNPGKISA